MPRLLFAALASLLLSACATQPGAEIQRLEGLRYSPDDWPQPLYADVYLPPPSATPRLRPAALVVHGGGWQRRDRSDMEATARQLAAAGHVAINIDYRFAPAHPFPAQLHDLQQAMAWTHRQADAWRIDTRQIIGVGYSSGAHLVSLLGVIGTDHPLDRPYGGPHARLAGVLAGGTPTDLFKFDDGRLVVEFLGGTRAQVPERYRLASPYHQLGDSAPPFFLFHGSLDTLVPRDHAEDFHAALQDRGLSSRLHLQPLRGHFASFLTRGSAIDDGITFLSEQRRGGDTLARSEAGSH
ncbi:alpha/beta hydrolase [Halomonas sp. 328]|uniref:alpha/beta hydrolase n=1 Tax=Halomonas sp. 328 TaxID=2776704 RepID=UPI0018A739E1|nr:alpha/beta hydrolase [Halomonas sp. 328]MBF8224351.1 alpha/beta hydrolase [Halomonas sp. 328]